MKLLWCGFAFFFVGELARRVYHNLRREAASLKIQTWYRTYTARKAYNELSASAVTIQSGLRGMRARKELHFRRQTRAAIIIQVIIWQRNQSCSCWATNNGLVQGNTSYDKFIPVYYLGYNGHSETYNVNFTGWISKTAVLSSYMISGWIFSCVGS